VTAHGPRDRERERIARDFSVYSAVNLASVALLLATGLALRRHIGPTLAGIWTALELLPVYAANAHLGIFSAAERELPFLLGAQREPEFERLRGSVLRVARILAAAAALLTIVAALVLEPRVSRELFVGLLAYSGIVAAQILINYDIILLRARQRFVTLSSRQGMGNLAKAGFVIGGGYLGGVYGIYGGLLAAGALQWALFRRAVRDSGTPRLPEGSSGRSDWDPILPLLRQGLPILAGALAFDTLRNADKMVIGGLLGATALGVYSVPALICQGLFFLPNALSVVLYPRLQQRYGATGDPQALQRFVLLPTQLLADGLLVVVSFIYLVGPTGIAWALPEYGGAENALRFLLFGTYFVSLTQFAGQFLLTIRKQVPSLYVMIPSTALAFALCAAGARWGATGVAAGTTAASFVLFLAINGYAARHFESPRSLKRLVGRIVLSAGACAMVLAIVEALVSATVFRAEVTLLIRVAAATLVSAPFAWRLARLSASPASRVPPPASP
jgi:O-antigen/teichoic acid export membrane protein